MKILKSKVFRIRKGVDYFEFDIKGIGVYRGWQDALLAVIRSSNLTMLETKSWKDCGSYGISHVNLECLLKNSSSELYKVLQPFFVEVECGDCDHSILVGEHGLICMKDLKANGGRSVDIMSDLQRVKMCSEFSVLSIREEDIVDSTSYDIRWL